MNLARRLLATGCTALAVTGAGWLTTPSAQAATVTANVSQIVLTMSPAEFWSAQNLGISVFVCADAFAKLDGQILPDVTMDDCENAITHCVIDLDELSWPQVVLSGDHGYACLSYHPA